MKTPKYIQEIADWYERNAPWGLIPIPDHRSEPPKKKRMKKDGLVSCPLHDKNKTDNCPNCRPYLSEIVKEICEHFPAGAADIKINKAGQILAVNYEGFETEITSEIYLLAQRLVHPKFTNQIKEKHLNSGGINTQEVEKPHQADHAEDN